MTSKDEALKKGLTNHLCGCNQGLYARNQPPQVPVESIIIVILVIIVLWVSRG